MAFSRRWQRHGVLISSDLEGRPKGPRPPVHSLLNLKGGPDYSASRSKNS